MVCLGILLGCAARQTVVAAQQLVEFPQEFDGAHVLLTGQVQEVQVRMLSQETTYTSFALSDGTARVIVFGWSTLPVASGDRVEVRGVFHSVVHAGTDTLYDTVEASSVRRSPGAAPPPGP